MISIAKAPCRGYYLALFMQAAKLPVVVFTTR